MFTRSQIELALSEGRLWVLMRSGAYWVCRRNGKTQTWKTRPSEFRIPIKAGIRTYGDITHRNTIGEGKSSGAVFVITEERG